MSDNPEMLRIKENTKIQSNVRIFLKTFILVACIIILFEKKKHKYHEEFEKSKGSYTVVADDPETRRVLENSKNISLVGLFFKLFYFLRLFLSRLLGVQIPAPYSTNVGSLYFYNKISMRTTSVIMVSNFEL